MKKITVYMENGIEINKDKLAEIYTSHGRAFFNQDELQNYVSEQVKRYTFVSCDRRCSEVDWCETTTDPFIFITTPKNLLNVLEKAQLRRRRPTAIGVVGISGGTVYLKRDVFLVGENTAEEIVHRMEQKAWWREEFLPDLEKGR